MAIHLVKKLIHLSILLMATTTVASEPTSYSKFQPNVIFGEDSRQEMFALAPFWQQISLAIAGKVSVDHIGASGGGFELIGTSLSKKVCPTNRFAQQITVPTCTGFLVSSNLLVTAGHCMKTQEDCDKYVWVFGYTLKNETDLSYTKVPSEQVFRCKKVHSRRLEDFGAVDYTIIELDRSVENRIPVQLGLETNVYPGMPLASIGHPLGLPLKFIDGATVIQLNNGDRSLDTDLDAFQGNSGSPVFDASTGVVVGITSHGHADHIRDPETNCKVTRVCMPGDKCHWSSTSRISNLKDEPILKK